MAESRTDRRRHEKMTGHLICARTYARWVEKNINSAQVCAEYLNKFGVVVDLQEIRNLSKTLRGLLDEKTNQKL